MTAETAMHTPGPWIVDEDDPHVILAPDGDDAPWFVAEAAYDCGPGMSGKANARLIAAAPDMLTTLRTIALHVTSLDATGIRELADEAIARAEGRAA